MVEFLSETKCKVSRIRGAGEGVENFFLGGMGQNDPRKAFGTTGRYGQGFRKTDGVMKPKRDGSDCGGMSSGRRAFRLSGVKVESLLR
jgi:hypothetical protein